MGSTYQPNAEHTATTCLPVSPVCRAGTYEFKEPTTSEDRICLDCQPGKYTSITDAKECKDHIQCPVGSVFDQDSDDENPGTCSACNGVTEFQDEPNKDSCKQATICQSGTYTFKEASTSSDR